MKKILPLLLLILLTLGLYAPAMQNGFVWDDQALVLRDPLIRSWRLIPEGFAHFLFTDATASDFYRPIQRLTYTLEYAVTGFRPALYHFDSVVIHLLAAIALLVFARALLRDFNAEERSIRLASFAAAIIWAIHPLQTSAVAYISGRADSLAAMFGFAGLYLGILAARESPGAKARALQRAATEGSPAIQPANKRRQSPDAKFYLLLTATALSFFLSALSKEAGLIYPIVWIAILFAQRNWKTSAWAGIALFVILVSYTSLRFSAEHVPTPTVSALPLLVRPIVFARAIAEYSGLILLPLNLHMDRDVLTHPFGFSNASMDVAAWRELQTLAGILLLAGFLFWLLRERKRERPVFICLLLTAITYLPISSVFLLNATVAEHWLYLPSAFLILAVVLALGRFLERTKLSLVRPITLSFLLLWVLFLGARTFTRTFDWKDQRTFLERTIAQGGNSARMLINLGGLELKENHLEEAKQNLLAALAKEPEEPLAVLNLAAVAIKQSDFKTAHELLARAVRMPLVEAQAYELMAVLENKETGAANLLRLRLASRTGPPDWSIEKRYAKLLDEAGRKDAAIDELKGCLHAQWYRAETWQLLAEFLQKAGRASEATEASMNAHRYDVHLDDERANVASR